MSISLDVCGSPFSSESDERSHLRLMHLLRVLIEVRDGNKSAVTLFAFDRLVGLRRATVFVHLFRLRFRETILNDFQIRMEGSLWWHKPFPLNVRHR